LVGIWLSLGPLATARPLAWAGLVAVCAGALAVANAGRLRLAAQARPWRMAVSAAQALTFAGLWLAIGGIRGAWDNPAQASDAISRQPAGVSLQVAGTVSQEPVLEATGRLLIVDVDQVSRDGGARWQPAVGSLEAHVGGPDDWLAPAYGDALQLTGKLVPLTGSAPAGVLARMSVTSVTIAARGGGNPLFAWLFNLRVLIAQGMQRSLPEPEAALLIGILLGLKTPVLRMRLALFTATGTIHH
jgi:competence protein ComEC